jgi:hypothetical protein
MFPEKIFRLELHDGVNGFDKPRDACRKISQIEGMEFWQLGDCLKRCFKLSIQILLHNP